jgi:hypothetical protein
MKQSSVEKEEGHPETSMTHAIENSCQLWHRRLAHINYKVLPYICKAVTGLPKLKKAYAMDMHKGRTSRIRF